MMVKCELPVLFWRQFPYIFIREFLLLAYTMLFEPFQFRTLVEFFQQLPSMMRKRRLIMKHVRVSDLELAKLFH